MGNRCTVHSKKFANSQNAGRSSHDRGLASRATHSATASKTIARVAVRAICPVGENAAGIFSARFK